MSRKAATARRLVGVGAMLLGALLTPCRSDAQDYRARYRKIEEPEALRVRIIRMEAGVDAESIHEEYSFRNSDARSSYKRESIAPTFGADLEGSIYHSKFLRFRLSGEGSYGWGNQETDNGNVVENKEVTDAESLRGSIDLLPEKPVHGGAQASYGRSFREYDFFTRSTVETIGYGALLAQRGDSIQSSLAYSHTESDELDSLTPNSTEQDLITFDARNDRTDGNSAFVYTYGKSRFATATDELSSGSAQSEEHSVALSNTERLGSRQQSILQTAASYSHLDSAREASDQILANASFETQHRTNLRSSSAVQVSRFEGEGFTSDNASGNAGIFHRLFQSLDSSLQARASDSRTSAGADSGFSRSYGAGVAESYTKRLGAQHRLNADASVFVDNVEQSGTGRAVDERHEFPRPPATESFQLNLPNVDLTSIVVMDVARVRRFAQGLDYEVFPRGSRVEVRRIVGGGIVEGSTVFVSYSAEGGGRGSYQTVNDSYGVRLQLWRDLWALYARLARSRNDAPEDLYARESRDVVAGTEVKWRHVSAGAEHEVYEASDTSSRSTRFNQSAWIAPDGWSSLSLSLAQTFTSYDDDDRRERDYRYTLRYHRALTRRLRVSLEAGLDQRRGEGVDQDLTVVRPELQYYIGQTTMESSYDYSHRLYLENEEREQHVFYAKLRRRF